MKTPTPTIVQAYNALAAARAGHRPSAPQPPAGTVVRFGKAAEVVALRKRQADISEACSLIDKVLHGDRDIAKLAGSNSLSAKLKATAAQMARESRK